ncbi:hypothetical protein G6F56_014343 [Rhizopus delemar]|nr:hypothetical protein G6F56_014343 [Rhizopus delemar]
MEPASRRDDGAAARVPAAARAGLCQRSGGHRAGTRRQPQCRPQYPRRRRLGQPAAAAGQAAVENTGTHRQRQHERGDHRRRADPPAGPAGEGEADRGGDCAGRQ